MYSPTPNPFVRLEIHLKNEEVTLPSPSRLPVMVLLHSGALHWDSLCDYLQIIHKFLFYFYLIYFISFDSQMYTVSFSDKECFKFSIPYYLPVNQKIWQFRLYHVVLVFIDFFFFFKKIFRHSCNVTQQKLDWIPEGRE